MDEMDEMDEMDGWDGWMVLAGYGMYVLGTSHSVSS